MSRKWTFLTVVALAAALVFVWTWPAPAGERGKGKDRVLSRVTFIHFRKGHAKPPWAGGGDKGGGKKEEEGYYTYLSKGAKWKTTEDVRLNLRCGENVKGSLDKLIKDAVEAGMEAWETPENRRLDIFGDDDKPDIILDPTVKYDDGKYRGYNTISFGDYGDENVIAVTSTWGYFGGPPSQREIVETHILMNDAYVWGDASADSSLMDIQNILTHELGHCAGMGDLYQPEAVEETMYGYSVEGEVKKCDLFKGDITGITKLYR